MTTPETAAGLLAYGLGIPEPEVEAYTGCKLTEIEKCLQPPVNGGINHDFYGGGSAIGTCSHHHLTGVVYPKRMGNAWFWGGVARRVRLHFLGGYALDGKPETDR